MTNVKSFSDFKNQLTGSEELQNEFKTDPVKAADKITSTNQLPDNWIYRIVVGSLGLSVILVIIGVVILTINNSGGDKSIPTVLTAISSGAIGALAGLLAPSPVQKN